MKTINGTDRGSIAEHYFRDILTEKGLKWSYVDDWYDFEVEGQKVEVKSSIIIRKNSKRQKYRIGRFEFYDQTPREKQYDENVWIAFILRHKKQCILYGFKRARAVNKQRKLTIYKARELGLLDLDDWIKQIKPERAEA